MPDGAGLSLDLVCACGVVSPVTARFCAECGRQLAAPRELAARRCPGDGDEPECAVEPARTRHSSRSAAG